MPNQTTFDFNLRKPNNNFLCPNSIFGHVENQEEKAMLNGLLSSYWHHGYNYDIKIEPLGEPCINVKQRPACPGFQPYITITADSNINLNNQLGDASTIIPVKLTAIIILDCDECRKTSDNPYTKSSGDVDVVFKIEAAGIGELCRRERRGEYYYFEETRYITCEVCQTTFYMPRVVYNRDLDGDDDESMDRRSATSFFNVYCLMRAESCPCRDNHDILLINLYEALEEFQETINSRHGKLLSLVHVLTDRYLWWRFVDTGEPYAYQELYEKFMLLLLANKHDKQPLPMEILVKIFDTAKEPWTKRLKHV
jgi:hypothetical protein